MAKCKYLTVADEVYRVGGGEPERVAAFHCEWSVGRFHGAPTWFANLIGGGSLVISPEEQCAACPAFEKGSPV